jgi:hypothetical protein
VRETIRTILAAEFSSVRALILKTNSDALAAGDDTEGRYSRRVVLTHAVGRVLNELKHTE